MDAIEALRDDDVRAVGVGVPSVVDFETGRIRSSVNIPLEDVPLRELLTERRRAAGVRRQRRVVRGAGRGVRGRRASPARTSSCSRSAPASAAAPCSAATSTAARPARRRRSATRSSAWTSRRATSRPSRTSRSRARWRRSPPGKALDRLALDAARARPGLVPRQAAGAPTARSPGHDCVDGAKEGDEASRRCLRILGERLGIGIANAINLYDPLEVVIGGGVSTAGDLLLEPAERVAFRHVLPGVGTKTQDPAGAPRPARGRARRGADRRAGMTDRKEGGS